MTDTLIELENLKKDFASKVVLKNISLKINKGDFTSILGASGCGKSTLLRMMADLEEKTSGEIKKPKNLRLSFVFQDPCLLPWLTVKENIELPLILLNEKIKSVEKVLDLVKLSESKNLYPHELSGGMKMRASIARALITDPEVLLMDEPFAALDEVTRFHLQDDLRKIWREKNITIVFVTHSVSESVYLSDRVLFLTKGIFEQGGDLKIELPELRDQSLKKEIKYNNYVTQLASFFREKSL